jgi:hypothetical protein
MIWTYPVPFGQSTSGGQGCDPPTPTPSLAAMAV